MKEKIEPLNGETERKKRKSPRDRGSGAVRQRPNGSWEGRVSHGVGRPCVYVYGKTKEEVTKKIRDEQAKPTFDGADPRTTVEAWLTEWLSLVENDPTLTRATFDVYSHKVKKYILPTLGQIKLGKLSANHIYALLDMLTKKKKGGRTVQVTFGVLRRGLEVARKRRLIASNPASDVEAPRHKPKERVYLRSLDEVKAFLAEAEKSPLKALFVLEFDTGCRLGELLALKWADVDRKNGLLHIRATLTRDKAGDWVATPPKTPTSLRTIKLPTSSVEVLNVLHKASLNSKVGSHWVFHRKNGKPLGRDGLVRCELNKIATAIGKPGFSSHSLRHSSVSLLMSHGVDLRTIQTRIGHSTPRLTLSLYSHAMLNSQDAAVSVMESVHRTRESESVMSGITSGIDDKSTPSEKSEIPQSLAG